MENYLSIIGMKTYEQKVNHVLSIKIIWDKNLCLISETGVGYDREHRNKMNSFFDFTIQFSDNFVMFYIQSVIELRNGYNSNTEINNQNYRNC